MFMRALPFLGVAILGVVAGMTSNARAAAVLDQQYLVTDGARTGFTNDSGFRRAETFTVGVAGTLSEIDIFLSATTTFTGFNILSTSAGVPTTTVLTTGTLSSSSSTEADFTTSLPVTVGEVLAIEPVTSGEQDEWRAISSNTYAGGGDFFINPHAGVNDFTSSGSGDNFQTFVTTAAAVPEPASLLLLGSAMAGMAALRRGRG
jgi:hypothetical protein